VARPGWRDTAPQASAEGCVGERHQVSELPSLMQPIPTSSTR
jgi:hypothetical protein